MVYISVSLNHLHLSWP